MKNIINSQMNNQLQYALFEADMAIIIEDENKKIQFVNQAYCDLLELPMNATELIGYDFATTSLFVRYHFNNVEEFSSRADLFERNRVINRDDVLITKSGKIILRDYVPIFEYEVFKGNIWYYKKVDKYNQQYDKVINMISHEFRTPIAAISSSVEIIQALTESNGAIQNSKTQELISKINSQVASLYDLIDGALLINKFDEDDMKPEFTKVNLIELINELISEHSNSNFEFNISLQDSEVILIADKKLLKKAFNNLISNAIIYSNTIKKIDISILVHSESIDIKIKDYGIGIPSDEQHNLFNAFYRGSNVKNIPGLGLSLVATKRILNLHKAKMSLSSAEGLGTEVTISFLNR